MTRRSSAKNENALLVRPMKNAIEERKRNQRRAAALDEILEIRAALPTVSAESIEIARLEGRP